MGAFTWGFHGDVVDLIGGLPSVSLYYALFTGFATFILAALFYWGLHEIKFVFVWITMRVSKLIVDRGLDALISMLTLAATISIALLVAWQEQRVIDVVQVALSYMFRPNASAGTVQHHHEPYQPPPH